MTDETNNPAELPPHSHEVAGEQASVPPEPMASSPAEADHPASQPAEEAYASNGAAHDESAETEDHTPAVEEDVPDRPPLELLETTSGPTGERHWYILKVQSNREDSIREALLRKINIAGLADYFGDIIVPTELVTEFKNGKKRVRRHKLYPGYIVVHMELNDDTWYLVRDTSGIGDFTGAGGKPSPMPDSEVAKIVLKQEEKPDDAPRIDIKCRAGDRVKITEGTFENFEGDVETIDLANGRVTVMINIFGRSTPVELEHWQIEKM